MDLFHPRIDNPFAIDRRRFELIRVIQIRIGATQFVHIIAMRAHFVR